MISIKTIRNFEELEALSGEWDAFLAQSLNNNIFLTWDWISNWISVYLRDNQLLCLVLYDNGRLAAIAPLWIEKARFAGILSYRVLRFLGSKEVCPDHLDFILRGNKTADLIEMIWEHLFGPLSSEWDLFEYHQAASDSLALNTFRRLAETDNRCVERQIGDYTVCPYVVLPASWDEYVAALSENQRRALKVSNLRLSDSGNLALHICESKEHLPEELRRLIELNRRTWNERGQPGSFATPEFERFHERIAEVLLARGVLFLCSLWLDDQHLGSFYGFIHNKTVYYYIISVRRDVAPRVNVGRVLLGMCIKRTIEMGCLEFDMLRGDERYKSDWTKYARRNFSISFYNRGIRSLLLILHRFVGRYIRQTGKTILGVRWLAALEKIIVKQ